MAISSCRVCGNSFFRDPLLVYENMPRAAQNLPREEELAGEHGIDLNIFQCSGCGLVQLSNDPVPYYKEVIRAAAFSAEMGEFRRKQFAEWIDKYSLKAKKVLELGCGYGEYLTLLNDCDVNAYGVEYGERAVETCRAKNLNAQRTYLGDENCTLTKGPFDAFVILNWLEHLPDINRVLMKINDNLSSEGIGLVEVPNFDMILRKNAFSEFIVDHLYYFTRKTLAATLEFNGFEVCDCREVWHDYVISAEVKKRKPLDLSAFDNSMKNIVEQLNSFISSYKKDELAVWGASHHAITIISLAGLAAKIGFIVDSATFKQNRFTPATHIPIFAPEVLSDKKVKAIIIMASSYSDEVAGIIRKRFGGNIKLSILRENKLEILK